MERILVVDDEANLVKLVSYNLKKEGFVIDSAFDGEEALVKVKKANYFFNIVTISCTGFYRVRSSLT